MVRRRRHLAATGAAVAVALWTMGEANGQPLLERFDPAERGSRFFVADSLELEGDMRLATGVVTSYGWHLRTFKQPGPDPEQSNLITHSLWVHPGASLVLAPGARFAIDIPVAFQSGTDVNLDNKLYLAPESPAFGDIRASFDLRLAGRERRDVDGAVLAAGLSAYLPTGSSAAYAGDDFARVSLRVAGSLQEGPFIGAVRVGYMYRQDELDPIAGVRLGSEMNAVLAIGYRNRFIVAGPELHGSTTLKEAFQRRNTPAEVLWGAHVTIGQAVLGAGVGNTFIAGLGAPRFRGVVSIEWAPSVATAPTDRDHDGVSDLEDMCPDVPGLAVAPVGSRGCPAAPTDRDGDGIIDTDDACPDLPGIRTRDPMTHGCPDTDHDGIPDPLDACPTVSGERSVLPRYNGCPPDSDGDGVPDERDACPDEAGVPSPDPEKNGCPAPPPDKDGDGILDADDACVDVAGPPSKITGLNGCPIPAPASGTLVATDNALARLAASLVAFPDVRVKLTVKGGDPKRAAQERKALVDRLGELGVAKERFEPRRGPASKDDVAVEITTGTAR